MALEWKGLEFETHNCGSPREVRRINPRGRVPALEVDGEFFVDSSDILTELERRFPTPPLEPAREQRPLARLLEDWSDEVLYFQLVYLRWGSDLGWEAFRPLLFRGLPQPLRSLVPGLIRRSVQARLRGQGTGTKPQEVVLRELGEGLDMLAGLLGERPFFCGEAPCRADLSLAAHLDQLALPLLPEPLQPDLERRAALAAWLTRVHEHMPSVAG